MVMGRTPVGLLIYQEGTQGCTEMVEGGFPIQIFPGKDTASSLCGEEFIEPLPPLVWSKLY